MRLILKEQSWSRWHWNDVIDDWNWKGSEGKILDVNIYSSCNEVELFLNGKSLGRKSTDRSTEYIAEWHVPYEPGSLKAVGISSKKKVAEAALTTADEASAIRLTADHNIIRADGEDLSFVTVELTDKNGIRNPRAENTLSFKTVGPGTIIGAGNANPVSTESFQLPERKAWHGKCLIVIKSDTIPGKLKLIVSSPGVESSGLEIETIR